jgi:hypothetical protein
MRANKATLLFELAIALYQIVPDVCSQKIERDLVVLQNVGKHTMAACSCSCKYKCFVFGQK